MDERVVELRAENQGAEREVRRLEERHELLKGEIDAEVRGGGFTGGRGDSVEGCGRGGRERMVRRGAE